LKSKYEIFQKGFALPFFLSRFTPAAESHGLWPWMNARTFGRDVAQLGRSSGATGLSRGAPQFKLNHKLPGFMPK
jgi:hypothetical protein